MHFFLQNTLQNTVHKRCANGLPTLMAIVINKIFITIRYLSNLKGGWVESVSANDKSKSGLDSWNLLLR